MGSKIRIATVDDHEGFLEEISGLLASLPEFDVVARGRTAGDACRIEREFQPDVLVLDLDIPGDGACAAREITLLNPTARILILTASGDYARMQSALEAGASGVLQKGLNSDVVACAIRCVNAGVHVNSAAWHH